MTCSVSAGPWRLTGTPGHIGAPSMARKASSSALDNASPSTGDASWRRPKNAGKFMKFMKWWNHPQEARDSNKKVWCLSSWRFQSLWNIWVRQTGSSSQLLGKIKAMFQTTNQLLIWSDLYWFGCLLNPDISQQKRCSLCRKSSGLLHSVVLANHSRCWDLCLKAGLPSWVWKDYKMLKDMPPCTISFWDIRGQRLPRD